jgi:nucleotide-binding universal stress UspA family protein
MESIVVGTDGSPNAQAAVRQATELAKCNRARLHLVSAYPDAPGYSEVIRSGATREPINLRQVAESVLARVQREVEAHELEVITHAREGEPAHVILQVAQEHNADLIVVGARGVSGFTRFLLGSVSSKLAHHAPCSLMIVREE